MLSEGGIIVESDGLARRGFILSGVAGVAPVCGRQAHSPKRAQTQAVVRLYGALCCRFSSNHLSARSRPILKVPLAPKLTSRFRPAAAPSRWALARPLHTMKLEHQFPSAYTCSADLVLRDPDIQSVKAANAAAVSSIGC